MSTDIKISELNEITSNKGINQLVVNDRADSDDPGITRKISTLNLLPVYPNAIIGNSQLISRDQLSGYEAVNTNVIRDNAITNSKLAANSVTGNKVQSATLSGSNIAPNTITGSNIALNTIVGSNIASATLSGSNIASNTITGSNIALNTITGSNISTTASISVDTLGSRQITIANPTVFNSVAYNWPSSYTGDRYLKVTPTGTLTWDIPTISNATPVLNQEVVAVGTIMPWISHSIPQNYLRCDGSYIDSRVYPTLTGLLGSTFGPITGTNFYKLPDFRGKIPVGVGTNVSDISGNLQTFTLGSSGGEYLHLLNVNEIPSHTHTVVAYNGQGDSTGLGYITTADLNGLNLTLSANYTTNPTGSGQAHNNIQPYLSLHYIIKAVPDSLINFQLSAGPGLSASGPNNILTLSGGVIRLGDTISVSKGIFADGTAATPSITNDGDTNTGIFFPGDDTIGLSVSGIEKVRLNAGGSVTAKGDSTGYYLFMPASGTDAFTNASRLEIRKDPSYPIFKFSTFSGGSGIANKLLVGNEDATSYAFFHTNGNVGIGTPSPATKLHVSGSVSVDDGSAAAPSITNNGDIDTGIYFSSDNAVSISCSGKETAFFIYNEEGGELQITDYTNNGNVLIDNFNGTGRLLKLGTGNLEVGTLSTGSLKLYQNNSAVVTLTGGNVGIGTVSPAAKLHIYEATGTVASATAGTLVITHGNNGGASSIVFPSKTNFGPVGGDFGYIQYQDDITVGGTGEKGRMIIGVENDSSGNIEDCIILKTALNGRVGINTMDPTSTLSVNGDITLSGGITVSDGVRGGMKYGALLQPPNASQTSMELIGIPNWVKRITVVFRNLKTNGTAFKQFQLGNSSGYATTTGSMTEFTSNGIGSSTITTGLGLRSDLAADILHGTAVFTFLHGTTWVGNVSFSLSNVAGGGTGNCYLESSNVDRIRLTTVGSDKIDAGTALGIYYEG